ncbi:MAG: hypothetical protein PHU61_02290 [Candidatus Absconditabacteria bacterium]|nr:hypothetical protein [Candidatus Absconditabacteria bacterium]MDD3868512.1 hypothetical protein [Candidatus Absconditabacteria bacterium]MDD4713892.1 hypothetical protein [Candidatus Absconditabacteria bacterium]
MQSLYKGIMTLSLLLLSTGIITLAQEESPEINVENIITTSETLEEETINTEADERETINENNQITIPDEGKTSAEEIGKINDNNYIYYYGVSCSYCIQLEKYLRETGIDQLITLTKKEVTMNQENANEMLARAEQLGIPLGQVGTPFMIVEEPDGNIYALIGGGSDMYNHFGIIEQEIREKYPNFDPKIVTTGNRTPVYIIAGIVVIILIAITLKGGTSKPSTTTKKNKKQK